MIHFNHCEFCNSVYKFDTPRFLFKCEICNVDFAINQTNKQYSSIIYYLKDDIFFSLIIHIDVNCTIIQLNEKGIEIHKNKFISFQGIWKPQPKDALNTTKKLFNLKAFS